MFVRQRQILATAVFLLDGLLIAGAWLAAYWLRFYAFGLPTPLGIPSLAFHLWVGAVLTPVGLLVLRTFRLHRAALARAVRAGAGRGGHHGAGGARLVLRPRRAATFGAAHLRRARDRGTP